MAEMTSHERFTCMFEHRPADRIAISDGPWPATIERWHGEGMPEGADWREFFGVDKVVSFSADNSPRYEKKTLEENEDFRIHKTQWGATIREWKHAESTPEFMDFTVTTPDKWREAKARMTPDRERIDWARLERDYPRWRSEGCWIEAYGWFGFDVAHSWMVGTETLLIALVEDPEWCVDMFNHYLDVHIALFDMAWDAGYEFDCLRWPDDMGYKLSQFFSVNMYRELLKPVHARAIEWAHSKGARAVLHSCGDIRPFIPEFIEIGLDGLNPLEVKAGVDPVEVKREYGDKLVLLGGLNAALWDDFDKLEAEIRAVVPAMKEGGGYVYGTDHSVPSCVSVDDFRRFVELAKELGSYS